MGKDTARGAVNPEKNVIGLHLDEIARNGALKMLTQRREVKGTVLFICDYSSHPEKIGDRYILIGE